jgi:hypothetical protein
VDQLRLEAGEREEPRRQRVRVPHRAVLELVASPRRRRHRRQKPEHAAGNRRVAGQQPWALDRLGDVGYQSVPPAADLVAKEPEPPEQRGADWSLGDDAAARGAAGNRRHLDHEARLGETELQRRVVEVAATPPLEPGRDRLEYAPVQPDRVSARTERQPVEEDAVGRHDRSFPPVAAHVIAKNPQTRAANYRRP